MQKLLAELNNEARSLASIRDISGRVGYTERTRFERLLYLILREYCAQALGYEELGGLATIHRHQLQERIPEEMHTTEEFQIVEEGLDIYSLLYELCTAHIYSPDGVAVVGGDAPRVLKQVAERTGRFVERIRETLPPLHFST